MPYSSGKRDAVQNSKDNEFARNVSTEERKKLASKGKALSDGSFPIANKQDLKNAIQAYGRASNKAAAKAHIIKRAKALGATDLLPDSWKSTKSNKAALGEGANSMVECPDCPRQFIDGAALVEHAESVHTLGERRSLVSKAVRTVHGKEAMLVDLSDDWLVYDVYTPDVGYVMYKQGYSMDSSGGVKISGDPKEVMRKVSYIPAPKVESAALTLAALDIALSTSQAGVHPADSLHGFAQEDPAPDPVICTDCGRHKAHPLHNNGYPAVVDKSSLDETAMSQTTLAAAKVKCKECDKEFDNTFALNKHIAKVHKSGDPK